MRFTRLAILLAVSAITVSAVSAVPASPALPEMTVYKTPTCRCCSKWVDHVKAAGFTVKTIDRPDLSELKADMGVTKALSSCHTAKIDGYVVEGHVPSSDIKRLIAERPDATGLTVPGMPVGSPGMEHGAEFEPYDVLLIKKDGATEVFAKH